MEEKTPLQKVVDLFNEYFGEDKVDLQGNIIMVYYPAVTVTNENDRSVDLTELYVKVQVSNNGKLDGTFSINRSEFTAAQWVSDYLHSHIPGIPKSSPTSFGNPCLGHGPIRDTCATLNIRFDEDIWRLFILELDKYIHTESLTGGPYRRMENIGIPDSGPRSHIREVLIYEYNSTPLPDSLGILRLRSEFLPFLISQRIFSFNYVNNQYGIADSPIDIVIKVSNLFIDWFNNLPASAQGSLQSDLFNEGNLIRCKVSDGSIYVRERTSYPYYREDPTTLSRYNGTPLWMFKGHRVYRNITNIPNQQDSLEDPEMDEFLRNSSILLNPDVVMDFVNRILRVVNFEYGREREENTSGEETIYI